MRGCRFLEAELQDMDRILAGQYVFLSSLNNIFGSSYFLIIDLELGKAPPS